MIIVIYATSIITIINNKDLRGVLAPAGVFSKKVLEDMVDFIELSSEKSSKESAILIHGADTKKSWSTLEDVRDDSEKAD